FADACIAMLATTVDRPAPVTDDVERILGRPAQSFEQWVTEHQSLFSN
ncbi:MAG TPA: nucleoside-diphosphate sugar epimerase, partial [Mycobacterium sp.]|nr:nucleoside-diphosphate sugar epimerase [Mycobacterium sp.]